MKIKVIASDSTGNAYLIAGVKDKILIECGVPMPRLLKGCGHDLGDVKGCLVSHEHGDHAKAAKDIIKAGTNIYASKGTLTAIGFLDSHRAKVLEPKKVAQIGEFDVLPFPVEHDAQEPFGFLIQNRITKTKVCFITDSYYCRYNFKGVTAYLIEANYQEEILQANIDAGKLPGSMASRTRRSHFEIGRVLQFLKASDLVRTKRILLMHLSSGNSNAKQFVEYIEKETGITTLECVPGLEIEL